MLQIPEVIKEIHLKLETFSSIPIKYGVYFYSESSDAEVLLFGYYINDGPKITVDVANGEKIPYYILSAIADDKIIKWAHNAAHFG